MKLHASGEDYLETILVLQKKRGMVCSVDVARHMEVSKPSVCHAVATLRDGGFLIMDEDYFLHLTDVGREVAEKIYERHCFFTEQLITAGVDLKTAEAVSVQIKAAEKRMAEIAVLRTHIVNYAKIRETYVAYRKAGYSRKFREEHEEEILLHQAAKNAFDEMGVKKLPKVKDLQAEYAKLLEEKKKTYAENRRSREEMRELLTAKANVDRLLKMDEEQKKRTGKRPRPSVSRSWSKAFAERAVTE